MATEKIDDKATIGDIVAGLAIIIMLYGIIALEIVAKFSYEKNTNTDIVLFVIEYQTLLNALIVGSLVLLIAFCIFCFVKLNQIPFLLIAIVLIALCGNLFTYKTPYIELQEKENKIIQDLIEQGKITEESLRTGFFDEDIKPPAELAVCFDKEFEGELCNILFENLLISEKEKIESKKFLLAIEKQTENDLVQNYNKMLDEMRNEKHIEKGVR